MPKPLTVCISSAKVSSYYFINWLLSFVASPHCILLHELVSPLILMKFGFLCNFAIMFSKMSHIHTWDTKSTLEMESLLQLVQLICSSDWIFFSQQGSLRERKEQVDEYTIPHGDWFEIVSCPHYLAEIVMLILPLTEYRDSGNRNDIHLRKMFWVLWYLKRTPEMPL